MEPLVLSFLLHWALLLFLCLASVITSAQATSFIFNGFDGRNMSLSGIAELESSGLIRLTNTSSRLYGRAFYLYPIDIKNTSTNRVSSFSSTFVFCISPLYQTLGGHGMAFVMSPSLHDNGVYPSQYLGILNATNNGNASDHIFAVEFDTVQDLEFADINDNHVGINLNSMVSTNSSAAGYWTFVQNASLHSSIKIPINLKSGTPIQAWIDYSGFSQQLNVSIAPVGQPQPTLPLLSVVLNLSDVLQEHAFVGFSGSTGVISGTHRVLSWSFNSNGVARGLDLSKLPSIVSKSPFTTTPRFKILTSITITLSLLILGSMIVLLLHKRSRREIIESWELQFGLHRYSYKELEKATRRFLDDELLGVGGFGRVYRGILPRSGYVVAVKRLSRHSDQGEREFISEMASTGRLRHRNLVQLLGWSRRKGELLLVYEFMPNGSLDKLLFGKRGKFILRWEQRLKVIRGVAAGMLYLHEEWEQQVLHRDIKASNVLLDADMNAKLGDFGLARLYEHGQNAHTTRVVGTLGYLAPEFARTGKATASTDVYSFGALLLEVVTGRRPIESKPTGEHVLVVDTVCCLYQEGRVLEAIDPRLDGCYNAVEAEKVLGLGLMCSHPDPAARPGMRQVVHILGDEAPLPPLQPYYLNLSLQRRLKDEGDVLSFSSSSKSWSTADASTHISAR